MPKYKVNNKSQVGKKGPGQYVLTDTEGKKVLKVLTVCGESKTDQSFKDQMNIKHMLRGVEAKGLLRMATKFEGEFDDYPNVDYQEAQFQLARAKNMFNELPSATRNRFENNPAKFMEFVHNPDNGPELKKMGLLKGNDGLQADGVTPSGAPSPGDLNANQIPDEAETPPA